MKIALLLLALLPLAACTTPAGRTSNGMASQPAPRFEHRLDMEYNEGATPFLHLTQVEH